MAKLVIAGRSDCPYFAKTELLADSLNKNLPDFKLHKIVKNPQEWESWLEAECAARGFSHKKSPVIWRELVDRGGKGLLIGGANEFQEYVHGYYGLKSELLSDDMTRIAGENLVTREAIEMEEQARLALIQPITVCVSNASSRVAYGLLAALAGGQCLGMDTIIDINLLDAAENHGVLEGVRMEMIDLAAPALNTVSLISEPGAAFHNASLIVLLDDIPATDIVEGSSPEDIQAQHDDWLRANHQHYIEYAKLINDYALKGVKILVAGPGPVNFITYMMLQHMPDIPKQNIIAMSRFMENSAKSVLSAKLRVNPADVVDVIVWGQSAEQTYIDLTIARVHRYDGAIYGPPSFSLPVTEMIHDHKWLKEVFPAMVRGRSKEVADCLGHSVAASRAAAIISQVTHWWSQSPVGQVFSAGVPSEGWYGVPEGLVFSFPVIFSQPGYWTIRQDINLREETISEIQNIVKDLQRQIEVIYPPSHVPTPEPLASATPPPTTDTPGPDDSGLYLGRITEDAEGEIAASKLPEPTKGLQTEEHLTEEQPTGEQPTE